MTTRLSFGLVFALLLAGGCGVSMEEQAKARDAQAQKRREDFIAAKAISQLSRLDEKTARAIREGKVFIGMTDEQILASWGPPEKNNRSVGSWGVHEQWVYPGYPKNRYLYLENGKLKSWQD